MDRLSRLIMCIIPVIFISGQLCAQDRIQPGHIYKPGDTIQAPRLGMISIVPEGWAGVLPRETEMFLLMSQENPQSSIYAFGVEDTREALRSRWMNGPGLEVENNIKLVRSSDVFERGNAIAADLRVENSTNNNKGYIEAKCSEYNRCLVLLLIVPEEFLELSKKGLMKFIDNAVLAEPTMKDIYENFSWADFYGGKYLATRQVNPYESAKRNNQLWMCPDGTFRSHIKVKGFASIDKKIKGNKSGTWEALGTGPGGKLLLHFKNLDQPLEVPTELRDDQLFINNIRYYVMQNNSCK
jgi:hypothetical protein